jgi:hypothetical protein
MGTTGWRGAAQVALFGALAAGCGRLGYAPVAEDGGADGATPSTARDVATGNGHSCAISDGALYCWGGNDRGQLGLGHTESRPSPQRVGGEDDWVQLTAGRGHTCAVRAAGELYCWGGNERGQLGLDDNRPRTTPTEVPLPRQTRRVHTMNDHTCAILDDDALYCWGGNSEGQLGLAEQTDVLAPARMEPEGAWREVACGQGHTIALLDTEVYGSGRNTGGELGMGAGAPGQLRAFASADAGAWTRITAGQNVSCGLRPDQTLWCWGRNLHGELGTGDLEMRAEPTLISGDRRWLDLDVDTFHGCAIAAPGELHCWGRNVEGQLGTGDLVNRPTPYIASEESDWAAVAVARFHTCGLRGDGTVWCAGENNRGQLGTGDTVRRSAWTQVALP